MYDMHSNLLWNIADSPKLKEQSLQQANQIIAVGITIEIDTPDY